MATVTRQTSSVRELSHEALLIALLASLSPQIASAGSDHHAKKDGGPNQWIRVKINRLL